MEQKSKQSDVVYCDVKTNVGECTRWQHECRCEDCPYVEQLKG